MSEGRSIDDVIQRTPASEKAARFDKMLCAISEIDINTCGDELYKITLELKKTPNNERARGREEAFLEVRKEIRKLLALGLFGEEEHEA